MGAMPGSRVRDGAHLLAVCKPVRFAERAEQFAFERARLRSANRPLRPPRRARVGRLLDPDAREMMVTFLSSAVRRCLSQRRTLTSSSSSRRRRRSVVSLA